MLVVCTAYRSTENDYWQQVFEILKSDLSTEKTINRALGYSWSGNFNHMCLLNCNRNSIKLTGYYLTSVNYANSTEVKVYYK